MEYEIPQWMKDHIESDHAFQTKMENEIIPTLATEASVRELIHIQRNFLGAVYWAKAGGKWGYRAILGLAMLMGAIATIIVGWKAIVALFISRV